LGAEVKKMPREVELPGIGKVAVDRVVDCQGQVCPRPQLEVGRVIKEMREGEVAEVLITNPPSLETIPGVVAKNKSTLLGTAEDRGMWRIYFRKGR
jgi:TusA-related sulfurtransferase